MESSQCRGSQRGYNGPCAKTQNERCRQIGEKQVCEVQADCTGEDLLFLSADDTQPLGSRIILPFQSLLLAFHRQQLQLSLKYIIFPRASKSVHLFLVFRQAWIK